jgi:acyl-coenzyme A synthetase/AMP-(fatty) acid ligase
MFYISLKQVAEKFPNKLAINEMTYSDLIEKSLSRKYNLVCDETGVDVLFDFINASYLKKPIIVLPKEGRELAIIPDVLPEGFNLILYSSGSTGVRKPIVIPERMLMANIKNVINSSNITANDRILTVCSMNHTAGLTCQTLGGLFTGSSIIIEPFNPFNILKFLDTHNITVTHVIPMMTDILMKNHDKPTLPNLRLVWIGSDCVSRNHVEFWIAPNRKVMTIYGLTEAGPPVIYHSFDYADDLSILDNGVIAGSVTCCDVEIVNDELLVRGDIVNVEGWSKTGDCFRYESGLYYYTGRVSAGGKIIPKGKH